METAARDWFSRRTTRSQDWPVSQLLERKRAGGHRISVVIPAHNEENSVGEIVSLIRSDLIESVPLVDELVVMDSDSTDATSHVAAAAGARVVASADVAPSTGTYPGKGEAIWKSLFVTTGDLLVFIDADLTRWGTHFVSGLIGPLLDDRAVELVKGFYDRLMVREGGSPTTEGGRVTELVARPLLNLWWPDLAAVVQPLAGEWAVRRGLMETLAVPTAYGVELASVIDTAARHGLDAIAQVDLGARAHEHQKDHDLAVMAAELLAVAHARLGTIAPPARSLHQYLRQDGGGAWRTRPIPLADRPPARTVAEYAARAVGRGGAC